ncbi:MAG: EAL domain-containing protein [Proteobacteria bacterium]|nr:EAL domain-containing protein [Pseudomonadota bacterium]
MTADPLASGNGTAPWKVLLVDDEPAVHEMSRLILDGLTFEGRAVELLSAGSAAEARELLDATRDVALALVDVVMETDDAGIALVQHIRAQLGDHDMQIVLRTGQPGMAPEQDIVPRYEINGYFLKTEITAQRLHSIVISGLRSYRHARSLRAAPSQDSAPREADAMRAALHAELAAYADGEQVLIEAQPEVELASNIVSGIELVPQWKTSQGLLTAQRVGEALGAGPERRRIAVWLMTQACRWARSWADDAGRPITVSIPIIGTCLGDAETLAAIVDVMRAAALPRGTLDVLVGEAALLDGHPDTHGAVAALRDAGATVTLADFGARTISLQRLSRLIPDRLKIHRLFVRGAAVDAERMALARSLIALAQTLNIVAIADGIASDADAQFFKWEGCEFGQGDALAPACAPGDVADFVLHGRRPAH